MLESLGGGKSRKLSRLAVLAMAPAAAQAFDLTPDTTRNLSDPAFLPLKGQLSGETSYSYVDVSEDRVLPHGGISPYYSRRDDYIGQHLSVGLTDRLSVNASINFQERRAKDTYSYGTYDYNYVGPSPPVEK